MSDKKCKIIVFFQDNTSTKFERNGDLDHVKSLTIDSLEEGAFLFIEEEGMCQIFNRSLIKLIEIQEIDE